MGADGTLGAGVPDTHLNPKYGQVKFVKYKRIIDKTKNPIAPNKIMTPLFIILL